MEPSVKIDKRTRAYKDSQKVVGNDVGSLDKVLDEGDSLLQPSPSTEALPPGQYETEAGIKSIMPDDYSEDQLKALIKPDYTKAVDNPGFRLCMHCGNALPPNDDGSPKWRGAPELCNPCIWRNDKKKK